MDCYHLRMLRDLASFDRTWELLHRGFFASRSVKEFVHFLETRLGVRIGYDTARFLYGKSELADLLELAEALRARGVILTYYPAEGFPDEPRLVQWRATCAGSSAHVAGGVTLSDERAALTAALAESLERYLWYEETDSFAQPLYATSQAAQAKKRRIVAPEQFVGFSPAQRSSHEHLRLRDDARYLWIKGFSWTGRDACWLPAQTVSAAVRKRHPQEPLVRWPVTTGLATWPTRTGAALRGALEIIERDAYMIMWLNQLSLPRLDLSLMQSNHPTLHDLLARCARYGLRVTVIRLISDAPVHALCAVVADDAPGGVPVTLGLKASADLAGGAVGAILEALRARENVRSVRAHSGDHAGREADHIRHGERVLYWNRDDRATKLQFLTDGPIVMPPEWDKEPPPEHDVLARIVAWCRERGYEFASVPLTRSSKNPTGWHVEMAVMPDLLPMHLNESIPYLGGKRREAVPREFGYTPRTLPFADEPHPFA